LKEKEKLHEMDISQTLVKPYLLNRPNSPVKF